MVGIISALLFEKQQIIERIEIEKEIEKYGLKFTFGTINKTRVVLAACGEGKVNAARCAQIMICCFDVKAIINIGVAGSMNKNVKNGDIVVAEEVVQHDYDMSPIGVPVGLVPEGTRCEEHPWGERAQVYTRSSKRIMDIMCAYLENNNIRFHVGNIATGDAFVADSELKNKILSNFDVIACEMEGAAIAYVCKCAGVEFAEMRDISDDADDTANDTYWAHRQKYTLARILYEIIADCEDGLL